MHLGMMTTGIVGNRDHPSRPIGADAIESFQEGEESCAVELVRLAMKEELAVAKPYCAIVAYAAARRMVKRNRAVGYFESAASGSDSMAVVNKAANPSRNPVSEPHGDAWFAVLLRLDRILCDLQSRIHRMRMDRQNRRKRSSQTCISGKYDCQPEPFPAQSSSLLSSQLVNAHADDPRPASQVAQDVSVREIGPYDAILGYEIVNGRERLIWGKAPDYPWAEINAMPRKVG
jgi:hypothetical protein